MFVQSVGKKLPPVSNLVSKTKRSAYLWRESGVVARGGVVHRESEPKQNQRF